MKKTLSKLWFTIIYLKSASNIQSTHTHKSIHTYTSAPIHIYTSIHRFFKLSCLEVIRSCHLLSLSPFLSFSLLSRANKIYSALIYSQASWTFLWAPWSHVSSLTSIAPSVLTLKMNDATPLLSCNPKSVISFSHNLFFSIIGEFNVQQFYLVCFGKQYEWMVFRLKAKRGLTADTSMWFFSFMPLHSRHGQLLVSPH